MRLSKVIFLILLPIFLGSNVGALSQVNTESYVNVIKGSLKNYLPDLHVDQIGTTPINGVYQVISGRRVFYVDGSGRYAMFGNFVDLQNKQSITQATVESLNVVDWDELPLSIALIESIGNTSDHNRRIAVFSDPDCPFCVQLEKAVIPKLNNITVYYFLFPLDMHKDAVNDSIRILCTQNPSKTFTNWMRLDKKLPLYNKCGDSQLKVMENVGKNVVGVHTTPTIILPNGQIVSGLVNADYLNQLIEQSLYKK